MTHLQYQRGSYDSGTKTLQVSTKSDTTGSKRAPKIWAIDPQVQIIALLKEQIMLLRKIANDTVPYHSGSKTVSLEAVKLPVTAVQFDVTSSTSSAEDTGSEEKE